MRLCVLEHCLRVYCLTVRCDAMLDDLEPLSIVVLCVATALIAAAAYTRTHTPSSLACVLLTVLSILHIVRVRRKQYQQSSEEQQALSLHAHRCWDRRRCAHGFTVFVWGANTTIQQPWWALPPSVRAAPSPESACAVVVPRTLQGRQDLSWVAALPEWRGGVNHIFVDQSDIGTTWQQRRAHLGCAAIAQSHMEVRHYVHDLDISVPLKGSRMGLRALNALHSSLAATPATRRRYWLTFRGTTYVTAQPGSGRTSLLNLSRLSTPRRPIVVAEACHKLHGEHRLPANREFCDGLDRGMVAAPPYMELFNTTFALVPGGRQPASFRLNEVLAAGCIPVFVTGEASEGATPYVRPFDLDWGAMSLHVPFGEPAETLVATLARLSETQILRMQNQVVSAWTKYLAPDRVGHTFYEEIEKRSYGRRLEAPASGIVRVLRSQTYAGAGYGSSQTDVESFSELQHAASFLPRRCPPSTVNCSHAASPAAYHA